MRRQNTIQIPLPRDTPAGRCVPREGQVQCGPRGNAQGCLIGDIFVGPPVGIATRTQVIAKIFHVLHDITDSASNKIHRLLVIFDLFKVVYGTTQ